MNKFQLIFKYVNYRFTAQTKYDIHSPFVYQLLTTVINDKKPLPEFWEIEDFRSLLLKNKNVINVEDFGAGSIKSKTKIRTIAEITRNAAKPAKYAQLLYRLVKYLHPQNLLELGTSLGISTAYMAKASPDTKVYTIEGSEAIAKLAIDNFDETKKQIDIVEKKETLKLIFKSVAINGGAITTVCLYPPFQQMYEEVLKECNILKNKGITTQTQPDQEACILSPSVAR